MSWKKGLTPHEMNRREMLGLLAASLLATGGRGDLAWGAEEGTPADPRLGKLKDLNGYFPFAVPATADEWRRRAEDLRRQILVACGLWPMPTRGPIEAVVHGKVERDGYTVERVFFQSSPGLYVTGSLYRPTGAAGRRPTVLCPHGHWRDGRFFDHGESTVRDEIKKGAEKFPVGGRYPLQARCVHLARMGCNVFHYDMLGYADSVPLPQSLAHGFSKQRPEMSQPGAWGLFSAQAELRSLSPLGLQTWNSVRALDWVCTLPDVDTARIGVTGASGGGTQTFLLAAVDDRPAVFFPAVMVSTAMQGGCTCENASYLRVGTGNVEIAALAAPKPLGMSAADDWTRELETKGLPELKKLYELLGVGDLVAGKHLSFPHNYNYPSRALMYAFFKKHLGLGSDVSTVEEDYVPLSVEELTVWNDEHPKPAMGLDEERALCRALSDDVQTQLAALTPKDLPALEEFRRVAGGGWRVMIGRELPASEEVTADVAEKKDLGSAQQRTGQLNYKPAGEQVPFVHWGPKAGGDLAVIWLTRQGRETLAGTDGPIPAVQKLIDAGAHVVGLDLLQQGSHLGPGQSPARARSVENGRDAACFVDGYNHPLCAQRVHDVLTAIVFARSLVGPSGEVVVVGLGGAGHWGAAATLAARGAVGRLAIGTAGFRFEQITDITDPDLWPGAVRFGDVPALVGLCAPTSLWISGEGSRPVELVQACYSSAGEGKVVLSALPEAKESMAAVEWILGGS